MAPIKMVLLRKKKPVKLKARFQIKGTKAEMEKILDNQDCIRQAQRKITGMLGDIQSLCHQQGKKKPVKLKARFQNKGKKAEMGKILDNQDCIREAQRNITGMLGDIQSLCHQQKKETEMLMKQTASARTQVRLALMFRILKAREGGDFKEATRLTRMLGDIINNEKEIGNLDDMKDEHPSPMGKKPDDDRPASD